MMFDSATFSLALSVLACSRTGYAQKELFEDGTPLVLSDFQPHPEPSPAPAAQPQPTAHEFVELPSVSSVSVPAYTPPVPLSVPSTLAQAPSSTSQYVPVVTPTPTPGPQPIAGGGSPDPNSMTIAVINNWAKPISVSFGNNAGGPVPVGNPGPTALPSSTQWVFPTGWAGRILVGPGPNIDPQGSLIEGSFTGWPDIDVSYVDGYSVPITCSANGKAISGCNIDLFSQGIACDSPHGDVCYNSARESPDGPAPAFFAACAGSAYTFPNDNNANIGDCGTTLIECCIGTSCDAPERQSHAKRAAEAEAKAEPESAPEAAALGSRSPTLLPRFKRHAHRHIRHAHSHNHVL